MNLDRYKLEAGKSLLTFEFKSKGPRGEIIKQIKFSRTELRNQYNLAFGDKYGKDNDFDDTIVSNNDDSIKIIATIIAAVDSFIDKYPNRSVYARGRTNARNRLYRMSINKYLKELETRFKIYGLLNDSWKKFKSEGNYKAFLIKKKN